MIRSKVILIESANQLLLKFPALVKRMEVKDSLFLTELFAWIEQAENLLVQYKIPQSANLSGVKAKILTPIFDDNIRANRRKAQFKIASQHMLELQNTLQDAIENTRIKIEQASELVCSLLSVLAQSSAENGQALQYKKGEEINTFVERIWFVVCSHKQLKASAVQLRGILSDNDIKLLLTREIDLSRFMVVKDEGLCLKV